MIHDIGDVSLFEVDELGRNAFSQETVQESVSHLVGRTPHGVVHDQGLLLKLAGSPLLVLGNDVGNVGAPCNAVSWGDNIDVLQTNTLNCGDSRVSLTTVRENDVCVVLASLLHDLAVVGLVLKAGA